MKQGEKWTYVNKKGEIVTISDSESLGDFSEGLAEGKKGTLKGFYDNKGQWVIQPQFEDVRSFQNGYAAAKLNGKWGLIDKTGKWIVEAKFDAIKDVTNKAGDVTDLVKDAYGNSSLPDLPSTLSGQSQGSSKSTWDDLGKLLW